MNNIHNNFIYTNEGKTISITNYDNEKSLIVSHSLKFQISITKINKVKIKDIHNSWLCCFTNPLELGTRVLLSHHQPNVADDAKAKHVSQVQED